jgi:hypothetical protein
MGNAAANATPGKKHEEDIGQPNITIIKNS